MRAEKPDPQRVQALALDLDGTMLNPEGILTPVTLAALKACQERGIRLFIATGRALESADRFRTALGAGGPLICFNGAEVADMPAGKMLDHTLLRAEVIEFCAALSREEGIYYQVFFPEQSGAARSILVAEAETKETAMYRNHTGIQTHIGNILEFLAGPGREGCFKSMFLCEPELHGSIRSRLLERFGSSIYVAQTLRTFLEVMSAGVSKGRGLQCAMEYTGVKSGEVIAFGDEENDLPMFNAAGFSVAPANAREEVRNAAGLVVPSNAEDGPALFLKELFHL